ncbi:hypothetical protein LIPSTDRAFT_192724 [Lipomyces starkeyi NRRL Y-11557]|uniref:Uncharacterized protein n=1 Tax=Lipomyces starkeyi NRRL Y-11557 TaxID=675824 RepID=A0A1E3PXW4_LIPST|nr:hypothetical protein LIPSTDRAFT_192724 [Lipomyces starkeyi NRRL Y-11557]
MSARHFRGHEFLLHKTWNRTCRCPCLFFVLLIGRLCNLGCDWRTSGTCYGERCCNRRSCACSVSVLTLNTFWIYA